MPRKEIHPNYKKVIISCVTCQTKFNLKSTLMKDFKTDICSACHPFYTGKQTFINRGRVEKFNKKWNTK